MLKCEISQLKVAFDPYVSLKSVKSSWSTWKKEKVWRTRPFLVQSVTKLLTIYSILRVTSRAVARAAATRERTRSLETPFGLITCIIGFIMTLAQISILAFNNLSL